MKKNLYTLAFLVFHFSFFIIEAQPANDNLADALEITTLPFFNTVLATDGQASTSEMNEIICESSSSTWWYEFTPSLTGDYIIKSEVTGSDAEDDTDNIRLGVYTGTAHPLTEVSCFDEDGGDGFGEDEVVELTSGTTYFIQIAPRDASVILDVTTSVIPFNDWTGAVDSDWANAGNWSLGSVPTGNSLVQILGTPSNQPIIDGGIEAVAAFIFLSDGNDLTIASGSELIVITDEFDGINVDDPNSTLQIDGELFVSGAEDEGIDIEDGTLNVGETGAVMITDTGTGIELEDDDTSTIDGQVTISNLRTDGIALRDEVTLNIGENAVVDISFVGIDGIFMTPPSPVLNIDGTIRIEEIDEDGIDMIGGTVNVGSTGTLHISKTGDNGAEDILGSNAGQITVTNVIDEAFKTGNGTFTNESTGTIDLSNAGEDCIDVGETLVNNGIVIANNCGNRTIVDGTFNNLSGGIVQAEGFIDSDAYVAAAGSILAPGQSPGCIVFFSGEDFSNSTIRIEIEGTTPCMEYDQIESASTYTLTDAILELSGSYTPQIGEQFTIMLNEETNDPITGTFNGLAEGATVVLNNVELSITYMGGTGGNDVVLTADAIVPVELLAFDGKVVEESIELNWQTASEIDNAGFEIERSENGKQFKTLTFVAGNGNTLKLQNYQWLDEQPLIGTNYYRLKQLDFDGQYEYSPVVAVDFEQQKEGTFKVFPNPTNSLLNIQFIDNQLVESISVFDIHARLILVVDTPSSQIDLSALPKGIYTLQIGTSTTSYNKRIVKQ